MDHKNNQYLIEKNKNQGMTNAQALGVFWFGLIVAVSFACVLFFPTLMAVTR